MHTYIHIYTELHRVQHYTLFYTCVHSSSLSSLYILLYILYIVLLILIFVNETVYLIFWAWRDIFIYFWVSVPFKTYKPKFIVLFYTVSLLPYISLHRVCMLNRECLPSLYILYISRNCNIFILFNQNRYSRTHFNTVYWQFITSNILCCKTTIYIIMKTQL